MTFKKTALAVSMSSMLAVTAIPTTVSADGGSAFVGGLLGGALGSAASNHYYEKKRQKQRAAAHQNKKKKTYRKSYAQKAPVNSEGVKVQKALTNVGYYSGPLNGNLDSYDSKSAIMQYQAQYGLVQTGILLPEVKGILLHQGDIAEITEHLNNPGYDKRSKAKRLQAALKSQGLYTGKIDGIAGKGTRAAVKLYQQSQGMIPSGALIPSDEDALVETALQRVQQQQSQSEQSLIQVANRYRPQQQQTVPVQTMPQQQMQPAPGQVYTQQQPPAYQQQPQQQAYTQPQPVNQQPQALPPAFSQQPPQARPVPTAQPVRTQPVQQQPVAAAAPVQQQPVAPAQPVQPAVPDMTGAGAIPAAAKTITNM
jgi:peptidoglycan hydrolase-like protein with peptidoglycan-binding domain